MQDNHIPQQWEARQDLYQSLEESMTALKYLDFEISDDIAQKDQAVKMLTYLRDLAKQQQEIMEYLMVPYADEEIVSAAEAVTAVSMGDVDCPNPIPNPNGDGTMVTESDFVDTYFWGRNNLILHFTQHANWRIACRAGQGSNGGVNLANAIKASIAGVQTEENLYWDPSTNVASSVVGPKYDPKYKYPTALIQKVLTIFDRTNDKALRAYKGYVELLAINRAAKKYTQLKKLRRPEELPMRQRPVISGQALWVVDPTNKFKPPRPSAEYMDFTIEDSLPNGSGNSEGAPTKDEMKKFKKTWKHKMILQGKTLDYWKAPIRGYKRNTFYSPDGKAVSKPEGLYLAKLAKQRRLTAEQLVANDEAMRWKVRANDQMGMRAADLESRDIEDDIAKQEKIAEQREKEQWYKKVQDDARRQMANHDTRTIELMNERRANERAQAAKLKAEEIARRKAQSEAAKAANAVKVAREAQEKADREAQEKAQKKAAKAKKKATKAKKKANKKANNGDTENGDFDTALAEFAAKDAAKEDAATKADGASGSDSDSGSDSESDEENT